MKYLFSIITLLLLLLSGCNSQPVPASTTTEPSWIMNPNKGGKVGAVGVAARTYDQKISTQRKLAITRALDELTLQQGVKVSLNINKNEIVDNDRSSTHMDAQSNYKASSSVSAHIEDIYKDKISGEIYIWMLID